MRFRPTLEPLDARVVPAVNHWRPVGVSTDATVAANWSLGHVPAADEDVWFVPVLIPGGPAVSTSCYGLAAPSNGTEYNSVFLDSGYDAVVELAQGFDTRALVVLNGTIDQPYYSSESTDITVTGGASIDNDNQNILYGRPDFHWTDGTLNSTSHAAELILDGATGLAAPVNAGGVSTADTIRLVGEAVLTFEDGTYTLTEGEGIAVDSGEVHFAIGDKGTKVMYNGPIPSQGKITLPGGSAGEFYRKAGVSGTVLGKIEMPILVTGGEFTLEDRVELTVTGRVGGSQGANVSQQAGITRLYQTSNGGLVVPNGIGISGGTLTTVNNGSGNEQVAFIKGDLLVSGGSITIDEGKQVGHHFGRLDVIGNITWIDGVFRPFVDGTAGSTFCDQWGCSGTFTIFAAGSTWDSNGFAANVGAKLGPAGALNNQANLAGRIWWVLYADNGFQYQQGSPALSFETQQEAAVWVITPSQDGTVWKLERTQN